MLEYMMCEADCWAFGMARGCGGGLSNVFFVLCGGDLEIKRVVHLPSS